MILLVSSFQTWLNVIIPTFPRHRGWDLVCTNNNIGAGDIYSFFGASWKTVQQHINIERALELEKCSDILVGDLVYVRCQKEDLESKGLQMYDCGTKDSYCTYLKAKIHTIIIIRKVTIRKNKYW